MLLEAYFQAQLTPVHQRSDARAGTALYRAIPNTVHFVILIAAVKSIHTVGSGVRGRSG